ncbi:MAG: DUF4249 domain-containing protein [Parafilimonas sp.]
MKRFFYILIMFTACKEVYNPPIKNAAFNYLVVEGNIVAGNDSTIIHLTRTIPVADTSKIQPETNASIAVESDDGETFQMQNENNGYYVSAPLNINPNKNYRLHIFTADGKEYASDFVPVKQTPAIDSVSWKFDQAGGINIYVNTHDVTNSTQYYRWQFVETWEHRSVDSSELIWDVDHLRFRTPEEQIYRCWNINISPDISMGSTASLSSDVIFEKKLINIPYKSSKVRWYYSVLVTQYALTKEAYQYWDNLKKNTEELGSIFDPQPFADFGNIKCITNPEEPVLGFISACSTVKQRLYIEYAQVHYPYELPDCKEVVVGPSKIPLYFNGEQAVDGYSWLPLRYGAVPGGVYAYTKECLDCRLVGGTNIKPPYMPR